MTGEDRIIKVEKKGKFTVTHTVSATPLTESEYERGMEILAKLIARAYVADHPELFQIRTNSKDDSGRDADIKYSLNTKGGKL